ncbi:MAG: chromosome segregation protein SMC [Acidobacteriota bacterium]
MLKLKRVDIQGFKSFYDRSDMKFHGSGIAAIVGPNGCGKSNISDAISWVLGEQSAKSLRGVRMEDVIFAGTRDRKPLGMAQVTLTMVEPRGQAVMPIEVVVAEEVPEAVAAAAMAPLTGNVTTDVPTENPDGPERATLGPDTEPRQSGRGHHVGHAGEITITRRLYRSGESEYLINGKSARLRDIQDIFSGTGLGPESYAIIEQGRIGQILSNKPADRRAIIEEAAGIGRYKTRKRLAESKLESSRQNLSRVFDILEEVGRQVNSLKRQASKAKRYEELRGELVSHLRTAVSGRFYMLEKEASSLSEALTQAQASFLDLTQKLQTQEREHAVTQEACYLTDAELTSARAKLAELNLESERTRGRLELQAKQIGGIDDRLAAGEIESQDLDGRREREQAEFDAHQQSLLRLDEEIASMRARLQERTVERDGLQNDLRVRERSIEEARTQVLKLVGEASTLRNQVVQIDEYLASMERDTARLKRDEDSSVADLGRLENVKAELSERLSARQLELESLADRRARVEEELQTGKAQIQQSRHQLEETRATLSRQKARRDSLDEILSHRAYTTESVKRLFTAIDKGQADGLKPKGVLADFVEVIDPAWEKASEAFLHEELEYVVVGDWNDARQGVNLMRAEAGGRATFLVHDSMQSSDVPMLATPEDAGVVGRLSAAVRLTNGFTGKTEVLLPRLASCFLVQDHTDAQRLAAAHPHYSFLLPDGTSYRGAAVTGGNKNSSGPLALKREMRELSGLVEKHQREMDALISALEQHERATAQLTEELEHVRGMQQAQEKDALALDHEQRKLAEESARAGSRLSAARLELDRLQTQGEQKRAQREASQSAVAEREQLRFNQEMVLEGIRAEVAGLQSQVAAAGEEHAALRAELVGVEERLRGEKTAAGRIDAQIRQIVARREELFREMERMGIERARLLEDNIGRDQRAVQLAEECTIVSSQVQRLIEVEAAGRAGLAALDESLRGLRIESQSAQERRGAIELELVKKQSDLRHLDETSRKELGESASAIAESVFALLAAGENAEPQTEESTAEALTLSESSVTEAEEKYLEVRARIEALGPVNTQALEEFQEASQRYEFLNTQRQDLLDSIRDTEKAIQELDVESRRRFKDAFEIVNENFKHMFRTLFGGGQGEMRLTDESNLSESGIDIMASPPGKKLQNVALLSGGEKCLTAMALLMGIFRYTPSPFCILDEVDAPLDEANIQRLTRLIKEMSSETQFIVITHAKRTMEVAQALYGVTMQEPGLSTLVSVRFDAPPAVAAPEPVGELVGV